MVVPIDSENCVLDRWGEYLDDELREELVAVEARITAIVENEQADADRNIDALRSHYVPK